MRAHWNPPLGTWKPVKTAHAGGMTANRLRWVLLFLLGGAIFQLHAQQSEADRKLLADIRTKAEMGDAQSELELGAVFYFGQLGVAKDLAEAVKWFRKGAEQGNVVAQVELGNCYASGRGLTKDFTEAVTWYRKAAEHGYCWGQYMLGASYAHGEGVGKDDGESARWFRKAAVSGLAIAEYSMGVCYRDGLGVVQDDAEAARWYRKAAEKGYDKAQLVVGIFYDLGKGVVKSYVEAYKWYNLAAAQGDSDAKKLLNQLENSLTREQIAEGQRMSQEFRSSEKRAFVSHEGFAGPVAGGTGFFISEDGFLVTNEHVVKDAAQVRLVTAGGLISAKVVKVDAANDLALLKADGKFTPLPVATSRTARLGNTVATVGFPNIGLQGFAPKLAKGEIASLSGASDDPRFFQISVPVQPGNSGGALVDERGNVVGVVSAKLSSRAALAASGVVPENVNYAVKSSFLLSFLESVPEVSAKLRETSAKDVKFEDVVESAEKAAVLVLAY